MLMHTCLHLESGSIIPEYKLFAYALISSSFSCYSHNSLYCRSSVKPGAETLIIYIFRNTDPEALNNLIFFLQHGIAKDDEIR